MHSVAAASRPRMSEMEPRWFILETSSYVGRVIRRFGKLNVGKVNICFTLSYLFWLQVVPLDIYISMILTIRFFYLHIA